LLCRRSLPPALRPNAAVTSATLAFAEAIPSVAISNAVRMPADSDINMNTVAVARPFEVLT
jgi:hypothetical protein